MSEWGVSSAEGMRMWGGKYGLFSSLICLLSFLLSSGFVSQCLGLKLCKAKVGYLSLLSLSHSVHGS